MTLKTGATPASLSNYRFSQRQERFLQELVDQLADKGVLKRTHSEWNSPVVLVPKGDAYRFTVDYKNTVNPRTENDVHQLPLIRPLLQRMSRWKFFAKVDLSNAFWHIPASDDATSNMLAFTCPGRGQYTWTRLPQGLKQAPSLCQRFTEQLTAELGEHVAVYMDDHIIGADTPGELDALVTRLLSILDSAGLVINKDKSLFSAETAIPALGFVLAHNSITPDSQYVKGLQSTPVPRDKTDLRRFLGKLAHVVTHYPSLQADRAILFGVLNGQKGRAGVSIKGDSLAAFERIKEALGHPIPLNRYDAGSSEEVRIVGDAGASGYASVVYQGDRVVASLSRKYRLSSLPTAASTVREMVCFVESVEAFHELRGPGPLVYVTDSQALKNAWTRFRAEGTLPRSSPFVLRQLHKLDFLERLEMRWVPRDTPELRSVDALGRSSMYIKPSK